MNNIDLLIEKYFEKTLTVEEQQLFQDLLESDEAFFQEFSFQKELKAAITLSEREQLKEKLKAYESSLKPKSKGRIKWFAAAASVAILVTSALFFLKDNQVFHEELYVKYYDKYPNSVAPIVRDPSRVLSQSDSAFAAYEMNDYTQAIQLFNESFDVSKDEHFVFYKAMSLMEVKQYEDAKNLFITYNWSKKYKGQVDWYHALILIQLGDESAAQQLLKTIIDNQSYNFDKAKLLMEDL